MITNIIFTRNNFSANSNEATVDEFIKDLKSRLALQIFIVTVLKAISLTGTQHYFCFTVSLTLLFIQNYRSSKRSGGCIPSRMTCLVTFRCVRLVPNVHLLRDLGRRQELVMMMDIR